MTQTAHNTTPTALVTGASRGLGHALATGLAQRGWRLIIDGRDRATLDAATTALARATVVTALCGDVGDPRHRAALASAVHAAGRLDLLVNNASTLGPSPLPSLASVDEQTLADVYRVNAIAPLLLFQAVRDALETVDGTVINVTSDAAGGAWPGWGVYGSSKAALEQLTGVLGSEHPSLAVYAVDPGDMRTDMHQVAFPGDDISDRPEPATVVPAILSLVDRRPASGRYRAAELPWDPAGDLVGS
ncbi:MAG: SDR family oxidoreductase [Actinobacteria bacterium]|nr:SDR family oxidoreductase [Actinomycetota bacterium]